MSKDHWFEDIVMNSIRELPPEQLEKFMERMNADDSEEFLAGIMTDTMQSMLVEGAPGLVAELEKRTPRLLKWRRTFRKGFEKRMRKYWGDALDRLEALVVAFTEFGEGFASEGKENHELLKDPKFVALTQLNARASRVATEILVLLQAGLTDAATARWRTLHEISITAHFIGDHDSEVAERYLIHERFNRNRLVRSFHRYKAIHPEDQLTEEELGELEVGEAAMLARFGNAFAGQYGWSAVALKNKWPTFADLEASVDLSIIRPTYQAASAQVHSGADGLRPTGVLPEWKGPFLAGPSNAGLADPGRHTALSLVFHAIAPMMAQQSLDRVLMVAGLSELAKRCEAAFIAGEAALDSADEAFRADSED